MYRLRSWKYLQSLAERERDDDADLETAVEVAGPAGLCRGVVKLAEVVEV